MLLNMMIQMFASKMRYFVCSNYHLDMICLCTTSIRVQYCHLQGFRAHVDSQET